MLLTWKTFNFEPEMQNFAVHYVYTGNLIERGVWGGCLVITTARTFAT